MFSAPLSSEGIAAAAAADADSSEISSTTSTVASVASRHASGSLRSTADHDAVRSNEVGDAAALAEINTGLRDLPPAPRRRTKTSDGSRSISMGTVEMRCDRESTDTAGVGSGAVGCGDHIAALGGLCESSLSSDIDGTNASTK